MLEMPSNRRTSFVVVIWPISQAAPLQWRGTVETATGARFYFQSLNNLNRIVRELGGWEELPAQPPGKEQDME